jgi:acetyl-CoA carboxylase biotin carboxyl carrier protein
MRFQDNNMAAPKGKQTIDPDLVRQLAGLLDETGLTELEFECSDWRVRVARSQGLPSTVMVSQPLPTAPTANPVAAVAEAEDLSKHPGLVTSPMVGVVYTSPEPEAPPFVAVGDNVLTGDTLVLIEAMKVFNPIKAPRSGRVARIFVTNGTPVEYGEPLLIIE